MRHFALTATLLLAACSGESAKLPTGDSIATQEQLEACLGTGLDDFLGTLGGLEALFVVAGNPGSAASLGLTWNEVAGAANTYEFVLPVDVDGDEVPDLALAGRAAFAGDPAAGIGVGDSVDVTWTVQDSSRVAGNADLKLELGAAGILLSGSATMRDVGGDCSVTLAATESEAVLLTLEVVSPPVPAQQGSTITRIPVTGGFRVTLQIGGTTFDALATIDPDTREVSVSGVMVNGFESRSFTFTLGGEGSSGPPCALVADNWEGLWTFDLDCRAARPNSEPFTQTVVFDISSGTVTAFAISTHAGAVFSLRNSFEGTLAASPANTVTFEIDYSVQNGVEFREEGMLTPICESGNLRMSYESAYRSTNASSSFAPGFCAGSGTK